jgi:hypothetical protein
VSPRAEALGHSSRAEAEKQMMDVAAVEEAPGSTAAEDC